MKLKTILNGFVFILMFFLVASLAGFTVLSRYLQEDANSILKTIDSIRSADELEAVLLAHHHATFMYLLK